MKPRKIIDFQIMAPDNYDHGCLVVLCDDGTIWEASQKDPEGWKQFAPIPQPEPKRKRKAKK